MQQHITGSAYINENMQYQGRKRTIVVEQKDTTERERERERFGNARLIL